VKIIAIRQARSIWIVPPYFLNPRGVFVRPALQALKGRYRFQKSPFDNAASTDDATSKYENGAFDRGDVPVIIISLVIHSDGFVVDTRSSTKDGDAFLEDALGWVAQEYGLPRLSDVPIKKMYTSEVNFSFAKPAKFFDARLMKFCNEASIAMSGSKSERLDFLSLQLSTDQTTTAQLNFRIDREANTNIDEGRLWSFASCTTETHLGLLEKLEGLL
jgi:hypothetical protein